MALLLGACGGATESHAPPSVNPELLIGKWQAESPEQLIQIYEFAADKSLKMTLWHMPDPVTGTYSWSDNGVITAQYRLSEEAKQACKKGLAAYREYVRDRGKKAGGQYSDLIANSAENYPEELAEKEDFRVGFSERADVTLVLISVSEKKLEFRFKKAE